MESRKYKRKRNKTVTIRMTLEEYNLLQNRVKDSGLTQQNFIIEAIKGAKITSSDEIATLKEINKAFGEYIKQLRGLATNVNQMAHVANGQGNLPTEETLMQLTKEVKLYQKESDKIWLSIRLLINQRNHTVQ